MLVQIENTLQEKPVVKRESHYFLVSYHIFANDKHIGSGTVKSTSFNSKNANINLVKAKALEAFYERDSQLQYSLLFTGNKKISKLDYDSATDEMHFNLAWQ